MDHLPLAGLLPDSSLYYGVMMGAGFLLAIYANAARMPRLLAFAILLVFCTAVLTLIAARTFDGTPSGPLP